jgi:hypothetical protein
MKTVLGLLMAVGLVLGGCGNNDCEDAADHYKECGLPTGSGSSGSDDCSGASECAAKCINDASCDELKANDINGKYFKCLAACGS